MADDLFKVPAIRSAKPKSELVRRPGRLGRRARHNPMDAYSKIVAAAIAGDRAPQNTEIAGGAMIVGELVNMGKIKVELYGQNWRVFELLDGPNKGARTAEAPKGGNPYSIR